MQANAFHKLLLLLPLAFYQSTNGMEWNYLKNGKDWEDLCSTGKHQSPILLDTKTAHKLVSPPITFWNYYKLLKRPFYIRNNGHSISLDIPVTSNGRKPFITGGRLKGRYFADGLHFHWGSYKSPGSEHSINKRRYDAEIHIVHRNEKYKNIAEAVRHKDGLAVVAIMVSIVRKDNAKSTPLSKLMEAVVRVPIENSNATLFGQSSLDQLIGGVKHKDFFTYEGSLTTPLCDETVSWIVFTEITTVTISCVSKFWLLRDHWGNRLINTYRIVQGLNDRTVFYRTARSSKS
ncbi:carbonic anhydrase 2 isoform X2 [Drosophila sechellia]|nr:carbonic anhydrase 2 isoform X2 [Drosophila sechellia]